MSFGIWTIFFVFSYRHYHHQQHQHDHYHHHHHHRHHHLYRKGSIRVFVGFVRIPFFTRSPSNLPPFPAPLR